MKRTLLALTTSALILCTMTACTAPPSQTEMNNTSEATHEVPSFGYYSIVEQYDIFEITNAPNLTFENLECHNGKSTIERGTNL